MDQPDLDPRDAAVEQRLRAARVEADPAWRATLERRLLGRPARRRRLWPAAPARRPAFVGALAAVALATVVLVASLAGAGPLGSGGSDKVKAGDDCHYVTKHVRAPVARVVGDGHGGTRVVVRHRVVERQVKVCG